MKEVSFDKKYFIETYGCQMNESDTERISGQLEELGYVPADILDDADVVILNTCSIRQNAEEKVYGKIGEVKKLKGKKPGVLLGIAGCMAQENKGKLIERMPVIDFVIGPYHIHDLKDIVSRRGAEGSHVVMTQMNPNRVNDYSELHSVRKSRIFAWVPIMQGCNKFCTYCIVPYVRGREKSRDSQEILKECEALIADGVKEIMLLGQNVNSYGLDKKEECSFPELLAKIAKLPGLKRLRFMTPNPKDFSDELLQVMKENENICNHIHLPLQSGSTTILKRMNRHYSKESYMALVKKIREVLPDVSLTTDIIVGFPGETEEDFQDTMEVVAYSKFDSAFTFQYSKRTGTPAAKWEAVPEDVVKERFQRLLEHIRLHSEEREGRDLGKVMEVLVEEKDKESENMLTGRLSNNVLVHFEGGERLIGEIVPVRLDKSMGFYYYGSVL